MGVKYPLYCRYDLHEWEIDPSIVLMGSFILFHRGLSAASKGEQATCAEGLLEVKDEEGNGLTEDELKVSLLAIPCHKCPIVTFE